MVLRSASGATPAGCWAPCLRRIAFRSFRFAPLRYNGAMLPPDPGNFFLIYHRIFCCRNRPGRQFRGELSGAESATIALPINRHAAATDLDIRSRSASCSHWTTLRSPAQFREFQLCLKRRAHPFPTCSHLAVHFIAVCEREAGRHRIAPVRKGHPAYRYMDDRDKDGIVCE